MTPDASAMAGFGGPPDLSLMQVATYGFLFMLLVLLLLTFLATVSLPVFFGALAGMEGILALRRQYVVINWFARAMFIGFGCVVLCVPFLVALALLTPSALFKVGVSLATRKPIGNLAILFTEAWTLFRGILDIQEFVVLVFRSLRRNLLRTALTYIALFVLTGTLTLIYGIVSFLANFTADKEKEQLILITEKFGIPSMMKPGYAGEMKRILREQLPAEYRPADIDKSFMTWSFVGASLQPGKQSPENNFFLFALDPESVASGMMAEQGLNRDDLGDDGWEAMLAVLEVVKRDKRHIVVGEDRLKAMNKKVGDALRFTSTNYKELEFDCTIVGAFPSGGRMGNAAAMRYDYLLSMMDDYKQKKGADHPLASSCLNLIWVRMPSKASFERLSAIVGDGGTFNNPAVKVETFSAFAASVFEPFKRIIWGMKWIIMPAIVVIMCLVIGITITIGVRERRGEMAVLKVLGFQPAQVQAMVVSESVLVGIYGGMLSTWTVYFLPRVLDAVTQAFGVKIALLKLLTMSEWILLYGPVLGVVVGLVGSLLPSRSASRVKVSEVFAQVA